MRPLPDPIDADEALAWVDAAAAASGLAIAPTERDGVAQALRELSVHAALVAAHPLAPDDEWATVFVPIAPGDAPLPPRRRR